MIPERPRRCKEALKATATVREVSPRRGAVFAAAARQPGRSAEVDPRGCALGAVARRRTTRTMGSRRSSSLARPSSRECVAEAYRHVLGARRPSRPPGSGEDDAYVEVELPTWIEGLDVDALEEVGRRAVEYHEEWFDDHETVIALLRRMVDLAPGSAWAFERLKLIYNLGERWDELFALYDEAIAPRRRAPAPAARAARGRRARRQGSRRRTRRARWRYFEALYALATSARIRAALERLYERHGRHRALIGICDAPARRRSRRGGAEAARAGSRGLWLDGSASRRAGGRAAGHEMLDAEPERAEAFALLERVIQRDGERSRRRRAPAPRRRSSRIIGGSDARQELARVLEIDLDAATPAERVERLRAIVGLRLTELGDEAGAFEGRRAACPRALGRRARAPSSSASRTAWVRPARSPRRSPPPRPAPRAGAHRSARPGRRRLRGQARRRRAGRRAPQGDPRAAPARDPAAPRRGPRARPAARRGRRNGRLTRRRARELARSSPSRRRGARRASSCRGSRSKRSRPRHPRSPRGARGDPRGRGRPRRAGARARGARTVQGPDDVLEQRAARSRPPRRAAIGCASPEILAEQLDDPARAIDVWTDVRERFGDDRRAPRRWRRCSNGRGASASSSTLLEFEASAATARDRAADLWRRVGRPAPRAHAEVGRGRRLLRARARPAAGRSALRAKGLEALCSPAARPAAGRRPPRGGCPRAPDGALRLSASLGRPTTVAHLALLEPRLAWPTGAPRVAILDGAAELLERRKIDAAGAFDAIWRAFSLAPGEGLATR